MATRFNKPNYKIQAIKCFELNLKVYSLDIGKIEE